jgi:hypothetical protein
MVMIGTIHFRMIRTILTCNDNEGTERSSSVIRAEQPPESPARSLCLKSPRVRSSQELELDLTPKEFANFSPGFFTLGEQAG